MRIVPKTERHFKKRSDGLYQELHYQIIEFDYGNDNIVRKVDKVIPGGLYREGTNQEHSIHGEVEWVNSDDGIKRRLLAIATPIR
jgi:hypothetical protein